MKIVANFGKQADRHRISFDCILHLFVPYIFRQHLIRHDNSRPFYCNANDCDLRFYTKAALNMHTPKHSVETPFMCPVCSKGFKWKHGLNSHLIVHSTERKLLCDECGYSTRHLKTLRTHQLSHTGFLFRCTSRGCSYTSRRKENLKIHNITHKNETPFVCEVCGHRFSQNKNLKVCYATLVARRIFKMCILFVCFFFHSSAML